MPNIVEKYIQDKEQLIILISGFSGSGKTLLAKNIENDFKLKFLNLNNYYKKDYNEIVDLSHDIKVVDWDNPNAIDWDLFNDDVNKLKKDGLVISGFGFPNDKLKFKIDYHIYLKISKEKLIKNRHEYLDENKDNPLNEIKDTKTELLILNKLSYTHFMKIKDNSTYTFKTDTSEQTPEQTYDQIFEYLIGEIDKKVYKK
jgi:cytidylate kinase